MGSAARAVILAALLGAAPRPALAGECTAGEPDRPFATCFDPGNRLYLGAGTDGLGAGIDVRHTADTEDPAVSWRLEHSFASVQGMPDEFSATLYAGRYLRHARDGRILLPLGSLRKVFVPFDIGAEARVGRVERLAGDDRLHVSAIRAAVLFELTRARDFRRRLAIGPVVRWDIVVPDDISAVDEHGVAPFSAGVLDAYLESASGLTSARFRLEAGGIWSSESGWRGHLEAEAGFERVLIAINDQPLSWYASATYRRGAAGPVLGALDDAGRFSAAAGVRLALSWVRRTR